MSRWSSSRPKVIANVIVCLVLIGSSFAAIVHRQYVKDQITVWSYQSTDEIDSLVDRAGMNDYGKFIYYASQPTLDATQNFNNECDRVENTTSILGCYKDYQIYIYNVTDTQLDGIREVTAAHETLHAVFARIDDDEKDRISLLLEAEYKKLETNTDYSDRMAFYARTEPGERVNELHSVIGTEVDDISAELEQYYSKYFSDRQKVVDLNAKYIGVFKNLQNHANQLADQLNTLSQSISETTAQYNNDVNSLNSDIVIFNQKVASNSFTSQYQFNLERAALTARVAELDEVRINTNSNIENYRSILDEYNSIATESKKLYDSIDSTLAPAPSV